MLRVASGLGCSRGSRCSVLGARRGVRCGNETRARLSSQPKPRPQLHPLTIPRGHKLNLWPQSTEPNRLGASGGCARIRNNFVWRAQFEAARIQTRATGSERLSRLELAYRGVFGSLMSANQAAIRAQWRRARQQVRRHSVGAASLRRSPNDDIESRPKLGPKLELELELILIPRRQVEQTNSAIALEARVCPLRRLRRVCRVPVAGCGIRDSGSGNSAKAGKTRTRAARFDAQTRAL